jgi:hypothetical protein
VKKKYHEVIKSSKKIWSKHISFYEPIEPRNCLSIHFGMENQCFGEPEKLKWSRLKLHNIISAIYLSTFDWAGLLWSLSTSGTLGQKVLPLTTESNFLLKAIYFKGALVYRADQTENRTVQFHEIFWQLHHHLMVSQQSATIL